MCWAHAAGSWGNLESSAGNPFRITTDGPVEGTQEKKQAHMSANASRQGNLGQLLAAQMSISTGLRSSAVSLSYAAGSSGKCVALPGIWLE